MRGKLFETKAYHCISEFILQVICNDDQGNLSKNNQQYEAFLNTV